jgi:photosystem II stability/assembly factor-like uncharacterized protein
VTRLCRRSQSATKRAIPPSGRRPLPLDKRAFCGEAPAVRALAAVWLGALASLLWVTQPSGVSARLRGVSAVSDEVAWASGAGGTVLRTRDGGRTWQTLSVPGAAQLDFRDVEAFDAASAVLLSVGPGPASRILSTDDAGASWQERYRGEDPRVFLDAIAFWDAQRGVAVGDSVEGRFFVLLTGDGGRRWRRVPKERLPPALPGESCFAASGTSVAVAGSGLAWIGTGSKSAARVLRSTDGGLTWSVSATPIPAGPSAGVFSVAFADARHGTAVGGDYKKESEAIDNAAVTEDGGVTWRLVRGLRGYRSAVAYLPGSRGRTLLAVGPSGSDLSDDGGLTWRPASAEGFDALGFASRGGRGWAVGAGGRIASLDAKAVTAVSSRAPRGLLVRLTRDSRGQ